MGGAASISTGEGEEGEAGPATRRHIIFEHGISPGDFEKLTIQKDPHLDETAKAMLAEKLGGFFFMGAEMTSRMDLILAAMEYSEYEADSYLMKEGDKGDAMYVIQEGKLEVFIKGSFVRTMEPGDICGELALLYNAPRSATVKCVERCTLWSLRREIFKHVQALASSASLMQRSTWLHAAPHLRNMDPRELGKLATTLTTVEYYDGDPILTEGELTNKCLLLEKGELLVTQEGVNDPVAVEGATGFFRQDGARRQSVAVMKPEQLVSYINHEVLDVHEEVDEAAASALEGGGDDGDVEGGEAKTNGDANGAAAAESAASIPQNAVIFYEGTFLGLGVLVTAGGLSGGDGEDAQRWTWDDDQRMARCPVTVHAKGHVRCSHFTVDNFERLFGPMREALAVQTTRIDAADAADAAAAAPGRDLHTFSANDLENIAVLGTGSYGTVRLARSHAADDDGTLYAVKALTKAAVVERGQIRHVMNEKQLLQSMDSNFICKIFGTFQDASCLYFVTEVLRGGDLWSLMYEENPTGKNADGLPKTHVEFYAACILEGLAHVHGKGIAFRDLKPENIMLDSKGYLRLIDFGFAKRIPFVEDVGGHRKVHPKSYTLCGTPEYLAPEFILNTGHDHSVDLWAYGVLFYEMVVGRTPFIPKNQSDMTQLFINIATCKKKGIPFASDFDAKAEVASARDLTVALLQSEAAERLGNQSQGTGAIHSHPYFADVDFEALRNGSYQAPFTPSDEIVTASMDVDTVQKPYEGDPHVFDDF